MAAWCARSAGACSACSEFGLFYLSSSDGAAPLVEPGLGEALQAEAEAFFQQPVPEKLRVDFERSPHWRGYSAVGEEITAGRRDMREQLDFGDELPPCHPYAHGAAAP